MNKESFLRFTKLVPLFILRAFVCKGTSKYGHRLVFSVTPNFSYSVDWPSCRYFPGLYKSRSREEGGRFFFDFCIWMCHFWVFKPHLLPTLWPFCKVSKKNFKQKMSQNVWFTRIENFLYIFSLQNVHCLGLKP